MLVSKIAFYGTHALIINNDDYDIGIEGFVS